MVFGVANVSGLSRCPHFRQSCSVYVCTRPCVFFTLVCGPPSKQPGDKTGSSPLPFLPSHGPEDILSSEDPSSLLSTLSITVSPSYGGQVNLSELALPDNVPVVTDHRRESASSLTDSEVGAVKGGGAPLIRTPLNNECMQASTCIYICWMLPSNQRC